MDYQLQMSSLTLAAAQQDLPVSVISYLETSTVISIDYALCNTSQYICFFLVSSDDASFAELDYTNNIECQDWNHYKQCDPGEL